MTTYMQSRCTLELTQSLYEVLLQPLPVSLNLYGSGRHSNDIAEVGGIGLEEDAKWEGLSVPDVVQCSDEHGC